MRILHYIDDFDFGLGGIVQYVAQVCRALAAHGAQMTVVAGKGKDIPESWNGDGEGNLPTAVRLVKQPLYGGLLRRSQLMQVAELAIQHDVSHLHGPWNLGNIQIAKELTKRETPYIISTHGMLDDWSLSQKSLKKRVALSLLVKAFLRRAAIVHCTAVAEREQVSQNVGNLNSSFCVVPCISLPQISLDAGNDQMVFEAFEGMSREKPKLLFLSRIHIKKGLEQLLDAVAILKYNAVQFQLLIAGPGDQLYVDQLKVRASQHGITDDVLWLGMVRDPLKSALYRASDVFVLPTLQENFGIVIVEAMAMGLPVVTTEGTDIHKELEQGGAVITGFSARELADAITRLLEDPEALTRRGKQGKSFVNDWLDEKKVIDQHYAMYERAMQNRHP